MKRPCLLLVAWLLCATAAYAQGAGSPEPDDPTRSGFSFGVSLGPNLTQLDVRLVDVGTPDYEVVVGFRAGVRTGLRLGPFSVHTGATFVNAGAIFDGSTFLDRDEFEVNFITIPVDLRLQMNRGGFLQPYLFAGPEWRFRLRVDTDQGFRSDLRRQSPTASFGAGLHLSIPGIPIPISPELRYTIDLGGLTSGDVTVQDELVRVQEEFKADMLSVGVVLGL